MKLRGKIISILIALVLVICSIIGVVIYFNQSNTLDEITEEDITSVAKASANDIADQLAIFKRIVYVVGHDDRLLEPYPAEIRTYAVNRYAQAFDFASGNIIGLDGISISDGNDYSDRTYVKRAMAGEVNISSVTESQLTGKLGFSIAGPLVDASDNIVGVVYFRMEIDKFQEILADISISENSHAFIIDATGTVVVHEDVSLVNNLSLLQETDLADTFEEAAAKGSGAVEYDFNDQKQEAGFCMINNTDGWFLIVSAPASDFSQRVDKLANLLLGTEIPALIIGIIIAALLGTYLAKPMRDTKNLLVKLAEGDFSGKIKKVNRKDEVGQLTSAAESLQNSLSELFGEANTILGNMAEYDLTSADMKAYPGEFNTMSESVNQIKRILNLMIKNVQEAIANVGVGAGEIADATHALSEGTLAQASSIQQVVSSIDIVTNQTEKNSENGALVNEKLHHLDALIKTSNEQMSELRDAVLEVEEMSGDIQKIVNDIDSISFQTNILALNASVEAARAGENGKGFAVVADEVGNLANKSGDSSKKTGELIEKCIASIEKAKKCADLAFESLGEIVSNSDEIASAFEEITIATEEQTENTKSIRGEVNKISDVVQTNTATAEETAASTQVLSGEAENLGELIRRFRV